MISQQYSTKPLSVLRVYRSPLSLNPFLGQGLGFHFFLVFFHRLSLLRPSPRIVWPPPAILARGRGCTIHQLVRALLYPTNSVFLRIYSTLLLCYLSRLTLLISYLFVSINISFPSLFFNSHPTLVPSSSYLSFVSPLSPYPTSYHTSLAQVTKLLI